MARKKAVLAPPEHCSTIREYEQSPWWREKSRSLMEDKETVCELCGRRRWMWMPRKKKWKCKRFSTHHSDYGNCPHEKPEQLHIYCQICHEIPHLLLRYQNISPMFAELAEVAKKYFAYEGMNTFKPW